MSSRFGGFFVLTVDVSTIKIMIDLNTYKNILIRNGTTSLSDAEIVKLRDQQDQMAEIFFDMWLKKVKEKARR